MPIELTETQRDRIVDWFVSHLPTGVDAAKAAADAGAELDRVDQALRDAGIEYPLGARGVRDLAMQRDGADVRPDIARRTGAPQNTTGGLYEADPGKYLRSINGGGYRPYKNPENQDVYDEALL